VVAPPVPPPVATGRVVAVVADGQGAPDAVESFTAVAQPELVEPSMATAPPELVESPVARPLPEHVESLVATQVPDATESLTAVAPPLVWAPAGPASRKVAPATPAKRLPSNAERRRLLLTMMVVSPL
jgi:hypothetical protein